MPKKLQYQHQDNSPKPVTENTTINGKSPPLNPERSELSDVQSDPAEELLALFENLARASDQ
jgi:hypothetical protein